MKEITIDGVIYELTPKETKEELFNDWRVPTIEELLTLVDFTKCHPASKLGDTVSDGYWSSTANVSDYDDAWIVDFNNGSLLSYKKRYSLNIRFVRDGKNGLEWSASSADKMNWEEAIVYAENLIAPVYYKSTD